MADNFSLFGPDPQQVEQLLRQQQQAEAMQYATQMGPQGNPFYIPSIAAGFHQGGAGLGQAAGQLFGIQPPEIERAYKMEAIKEAVNAKGVDAATDPVGYAKLAASELLKAGMHNEALKAMEWAQKVQSEQADIEYKGALGEQARAVAKEKIDLLDEKAAEMAARTALLEAKTKLEDIKGEIQQAEEARAAAREPTEIKLLDAKIAKLKADAAAAGAKARGAVGRMSRENMNQMLARMLEEDVIAGRKTRQEAMEILQAGAVDPMRMLMQSMAAGGGFSAPTPPVQGKKTKTIDDVEAEKEIKDMATKAWGKYEPSLYNYRINPQTGKIQRARKQ